MFQNILIPIDVAHADRTEAMLQSVAPYAKNGAKITLLSVVQELPAYIAAELPDSVYTSAADYVTSGLREIASAQGLDPDAVVVAKHGSAAQSILDHAEKNDVDLIVIGSHKPGVSDYLIGSVASKVVRHAHCNVLVIR